MIQLRFVDISKGLVDVGSAVHGSVLPKLEVISTRTDVLGKHTIVILR